MIKFEKNTELFLSMKKLILSIMDLDNYLTEIVDYNGAVLNPKKEKQLISILKQYNIPCDNLKCDSRILTENPYFKNIKLDNVISSDIRYENCTIKKKTLMNTDFHKSVGRYLFYYDPIGFFDRNVSLPALKEGDSKVWMSPAVSEIKSMGDGMKKGHGRCMTMGLGLGVLPYMWLLKDDVESVTVVEKNKTVIELFEKYIRPQFPQDKILEIIHGDAFDYYNEEFLNKFDYVYVDFWESTDDGFEYYNKLMEKNIDLDHVDYWIESSILSDVQNITATYLFTVYKGKSISDFIASLDIHSMMIARKVNKYFKTRDDIITTEEDLLDIIHSTKVMREILAVHNA